MLLLTTTTLERDTYFRLLVQVLNFSCKVLHGTLSESTGHKVVSGSGRELLSHE